MSDPEGSTAQGTEAPPPPAAPPPMTRAPAPMNSVLASYSTAELFLIGGALIVVATDVIFDVVVDKYPFSDITAAAAVAALLAILLGSRMAGSGRTGLVIAVGAVGVAIYAAARDLYFDLRALTGGVDVMFLLGAVAMYIGVALMAWGAWQLWRARPAS